MSQPSYVLEIRNADGVSTTHELSDEVVVLGRSQSRADLQVDDAKVSSQHAEIRFFDGEVYIRDLGSTNGTLFDGTLQTESFQLTPGASFVMGNTTLRLMAIHGLEQADNTMVMAPAWMSEDEDSDMESTRALDASQIALLTGDEEPVSPVDDSQSISVSQVSHEIDAIVPEVPAAVPALAPEPTPEPVVEVSAVEAPKPVDKVLHEAPTSAPMPALTSSKSDQLTPRQKDTLAAVELLPGENLLHVWEGDGFYLGNNPIAMMLSFLIRVIWTLMGGHVRLYLVLTNQRMLFARSVKLWCGWTSFNVHHTFSANSIKNAGIRKDTAMCCLHSRVVEVSSHTATHGAVVRGMNDSEMKAFLNTMSEFIRTNFKSY